MNFTWSNLKDTMKYWNSEQYHTNEEEVKQMFVALQYIICYLSCIRLVVHLITKFTDYLVYNWSSKDPFLQIYIASFQIKMKVDYGICIIWFQFQTLGHPKSFRFISIFFSSFFSVLLVLITCNLANWRKKLECFHLLNNIFKGNMITCRT